MPNSKLCRFWLESCEKKDARVAISLERACDGGKLRRAADETVGSQSALLCAHGPRSA